MFALDAIEEFFDRLHSARKDHLPAPKTQSTDIQARQLPRTVDQVTLKQWDKGVFTVELLRLKRTLQSTPDGRKQQGELLDRAQVAGNPEAVMPDIHYEVPIQEGTFRGTKLAISELYGRVERLFISYFDVTQLEASLPVDIPLSEKKLSYNYQPESGSGSDNYPPHLLMIPPKDQVATWNIFNKMGLLNTATIVPQFIPTKILDWWEGTPEVGKSIAAIEAYNRKIRTEKFDVGKEPNCGEEPDWFSDFKFGQQQFTGNQPTTITVATERWISEFGVAARAQKLTAVDELIAHATPGSLYVQDYSDYRQAMRLPDADDFSCGEGDEARYASCSVCLFQLNAQGRLHPVGIVIDYKGAMDRSIVIFNRRLQPVNPKASQKQAQAILEVEKIDWPWRYAKTCVQVSDWFRHEVEVHLTRTHLIDEAIIVATQRNIPCRHIIFRLLEPHWFKTLSLNAAARITLVPNIIVDLVGFKPEQLYAFMTAKFEGFDYQGSYIPRDLESRGFPLNKLNTDPRYSKYTYARNMIYMWQTLRQYVSDMLAIEYKTDADVVNDDFIGPWCREIQTNGKIKTFPDIKTIEQLTDAITMYIHIASPQHTAVNYLQNYYQAFVLNKPPALCSQMPASLDVLKKYTEKDLMAALPINRARQWLLASHLPNLLSFRQPKTKIF